MEALNSLPDNGVPSDLLSVGTEYDGASDDAVEVPLGPSGSSIDEDVVYNETTEMSSLLPVGDHHQRLSTEDQTHWPSVAGDPLNEYQTSYLATMAFPTLFPDGKEDPSNQALLRDVPSSSRMN